MIYTATAVLSATPDKNAPLIPSVLYIFPLLCNPIYCPLQQLESAR